ncbi:TolC family protein [Pedobacter sp. V48]|uniref:TolC family protein n=1 Tax=Pedobacter sp. V48 TaxID=509635 RepID=UPI0003E5C185|nr:TolC family protein [Pedobacter sp. V48]ETZ24018.1 hypothetical protein N824_15885 [Pedobacter sp. V48]
MLIIIFQFAFKFLNFKININKSLLLLILLPFLAKSQKNQSISLKGAIRLAQKNSLDYKIAVYMARSSYWDYKAYNSSFLPKLTLNGTLPNYYRTINMITLPSGANDFVSQNVANSSLNLNLSQNIAYTGGSIAVSSSLQRIDNLGRFSNTAYTSIPLSISYFQNNLFYNPIKWKKKIEPLKLQESQREYIENLEDISYKTIDKYFNLLIADVQYKLDQQNLINIDTLLKITLARFEIGTVNLNDILQAKVSLLNAKKSLAASTLLLETAKQGFIRYVKLDKDKKINLLTPDTLLFFDISTDDALKHAKNNRKYPLSFKRRLLQAQETVNQTKSQTGPSVSINANIGLSQTGNGLQNSYTDLLRNQSVIIGFSVPLIDWGVNKSNRKRANANLDLENTNIIQEELANEQEISTEILKWGMQKELIEIAKETRMLAQQRYDIARQKYSMGSISYTDFNNAQMEKDRAVTDYISNLRNYWSMYYTIRKITLYDFEINRKIELSDIPFD